MDFGTVSLSMTFIDGWKIFAPPVSQAVFHIVTGLVMAIFYALVLEPKLPGRPFFKGVAYGTAIWFLNAFLVLPLTDEGIAGSRHINTVGLIAFDSHALAQTLPKVKLNLLRADISQLASREGFLQMLNAQTISVMACARMPKATPG